MRDAARGAAIIGIWASCAAMLIYGHTSGWIVVPAMFATICIWETK